MEKKDLVAEFYPEVTNMTDEEYYDFMDSLPQDENYIINREFAFKNGIGKNKFCNCEPSREGDDLSQFKNLLEWDISAWNYQEEYKKDLPGFKSSPYDINHSMYGEWIKFIEDDKLIYGFLHSLHSYLANKMEDYLYELVENEIPHEIELKSSPMDGHLHENMLVVKNANGREEDLKILNYYIFHDYMDTEMDLRIDGVISSMTGVFRINEYDDPVDPQSFFIFTDKDSLEQVTFESFVDDVEAIKKDNSILDSIVKVILEITKNDFELIVKRLKIRR